MELVIYEGGGLDGETIESLLKEAAQPGGEPEVRVTVCRTKEQVADALRLAARREVPQTERHVPFQSQEGLRLLKLSQVRYFKGDGHQVLVVLRDGSTLKSRTLRVSWEQELKELLKGRSFLQAARVLFINMDVVDSVSPLGVRLDNGEVLNISRRFYRLLAAQKCGRAHAEGSGAET